MFFSPPDKYKEKKKLILISNILYLLWSKEPRYVLYSFLYIKVY